MFYFIYMQHLNYHHLRYFREVAREGNLSNAAERLNVSQSALSIQIKQLEERLGHPLFERVGRKLVITEVGRIALDHAERIFTTGEELIATLNQSSAALPPLRVGSLSTLSRNFQIAFLRPVLKQADLEIVLKSGNMEGLLAELKALSLDVILTTQLPVDDSVAQYSALRIADQAIGVHGVPPLLGDRTLKDLLANQPLIVPTDRTIRSGFNSLIERLGVTPRIAANVDDMAMVRLLAREGVGLAIAPSVVFSDEIASGEVRSAPFDLEITEPFYAVSINRKFSHPLLEVLLNSKSVV
ncbi:MAG: LysR family transcriptional regulator [Pseudomonadota bacterium]